MRSRILAALLTGLALVSDARAQEPKTFFDYVETSYVVAQVQTAAPLKFRDGKLLAFPTKITDVSHARVGKPQTLMLIHELRGEETAAPFPSDAPFFAPIVLLPQYSYWRDNLPKVPHHQIVGGTRYIFRGDDIAEAKRVTAPFAASLALERASRWPSQADAIVGALGSRIVVLREDAARYLAAHDVLLQKMSPETRERLVGFLESDAPPAERAGIIDAIGRAKITDMAPALEKIAAKDELVAVAALLALDTLGFPRSREALEALANAKTEAVRAYAFETMGEKAASDPDYSQRATTVLGGDETPLVRAAAARGLGKSHDARAIEPLAAALARGDEASKDAAAAIAAIGGPAAAETLKTAIVSGKPESMTAGVLAMVRLHDQCTDCMAFLAEQHERHPDEGVRDLIAIMLELDKRKHEH